MADRFVFCSVCGGDTLHTVSGSGRHKSCWDCRDREIRKRKAEVIQIVHRDGWVAMEMPRGELASAFPNGMNEDFSVKS